MSQALTVYASVVAKRNTMDLEGMFERRNRDAQLDDLQERVERLRERAKKLESKAATLREKAASFEYAYGRLKAPGGCSTCAHAKQVNGKWVERGYSAPCVSCERPIMSNWDRRQGAVEGKTNG